MNPNLNINPKTKVWSNIFSDEEIFYPETDGEPMAETDKHRNLIVEIIENLKRHFAADEEVYITGNIMFYYLEGVPEEVVSPDVMVVFGVKNIERRTYKLWEEKKPVVIIEIASHSTFKKDRTDKRELYESLGVNEYFIFNPEYPKTLPALIAYRLENGEYQPLKIENGRVFSQSLNLELVDTGNWLRMFDPNKNEFVPTANELIEAGKTEIERLTAELAKLKNG
jgi:Uma2 family endonuclease